MFRKSSTFSDEDKGYALRSQLGWPCLDNGKLKTPSPKLPGLKKQEALLG